MNLNLDIAKKDISFLYRMYYDFQYSYYRRQNYCPVLTREKFLEENLIIVFDCNFQNDSIKTGSVDVRLEIEISAAVPANTLCHCLIIHDKVVQYSPLTNLVKRI